MPTSVVTHRFATPGSTGNIDITTSKLGGQTPKAAIFYLTQATADGTVTDGRLFMCGMTDGTNEYASTHSDQHNVGTQNNSRDSVSSVISAFAHNSTTVQCAATFVAWISDGVRLNFGTISNLYLITAVFFAGSGVEADVRNVALGTGTSNLAVTGVGFQPKLMFASGNNDDLAASLGAFGAWPMGVAFDNGSTIEQASQFGILEDGVGTTETYNAITNGIIHGQINFARTGYQYQNAVASMDSDGYTLTRTSSSIGDDVQILALNIDVDAYVAIEDSPTSTGDWTVTGPGFQPQAAGIMMTMLQTTGSFVGTGDAGPIGASVFDDTDAYSNTVASQDAVTTTNTQSVSDDTQVNLYDHAGTQVFLTSEADPFTASGLAINFTTVDGTARKWIVWAVEESAETAIPLLMNSYRQRRIN